MSLSGAGKEQGIELESVVKGQQIGTRTIEVSRSDLIKYAGASGDFNPIHWDESFAQGVGLPGVIAHGMFTMGAALQLVNDWVGDPGAIVDYQTRFTKPVPVPAEGNAEIEVSAVVGEVDQDNGRIRVDLDVRSGGQKVLVKAQVLVRAY